MSTPAPQPAVPPPPAGLPLATDPPPASAVPYGGAVLPADQVTASAPMTAESVARSVGQAAMGMTIRTIIFFVLKAIVKAIFKR